MISQNIIRVLIGLLLIVTSSPAWSQQSLCDSIQQAVDSVQLEPAAEVEPQPARSTGIRESNFWKDFQITGGQLTLPFKIRPKAETNSFRLTTDVTVGAYIGLTKRLSVKKNYRLIIPLAAGLTFININDSNTSLDLALQEAEVVPGLSWSTGIILELEKYSLGLMFGKDYASEVGNQWKYHRKIWWSFGIGFTFFH
jgi:hypothetical protein